jgi:hypothetical protein
MFRAVENFVRNNEENAENALLFVFAQIFCVLSLSLYSYYYWLSSQLLFFPTN